MPRSSSSSSSSSFGDPYAFADHFLPPESDSGYHVHDVSLPGVLNRGGTRGRDLEREMREKEDQLESLLAEKRELEELRERQSRVQDRRDAMIDAVSEIILKLGRRVVTTERLALDLERSGAVCRKNLDTLQLLSPERIGEEHLDEIDEAIEMLADLEGEYVEDRERIEERVRQLSGESEEAVEAIDLGSSLRRGTLFFLPVMAVGAVILVVTLMLLGQGAS